MKPIPFNEYHYATVKFNIKYSPTANSVKFDTFLEQIQPDTDNREAILEILAYCMLPDHHLKKFFIFFGEQDTGKSVLLNVFTKFIGEENVTHIPIQQIDKSFNLCNLHNKMGNFCDEISKKPVYDLSTLKNLTGGGFISADRKYRSRISFRSFAKHIYVANERPAIYDDHKAVWSRLYSIEFPNQISIENMIHGLDEQLTTPEELSGLLNHVLSSLQVLLRTKNFSHDMSPEENREEYLIGTNILPLFCGDMLFEQDESYIDRKELWTNICRYARARKADAPSMISVTKALPKMIYTFSGRKRVDGKQRSVWYNIAYVPDYDEKMEEYENDD